MLCWFGRADADSGDEGPERPTGDALMCKVEVLLRCSAAGGKNCAGGAVGSPSG
jgi:hypothetical protein